MGFNVNVVLLEDMKLKFKCCGIPEKEDSQVPIENNTKLSKCMYDLQVENDFCNIF